VRVVVMSPLPTNIVRLQDVSINWEASVSSSQRFPWATEFATIIALFGPGPTARQQWRAKAGSTGRSGILPGARIG